MFRLIHLAVLFALALTFGCANRRDLPRLEDDWASSRLPADARYTHLVFRSYGEPFVLSVGGQALYAFDDRSARGALHLHVVPLPPGSAGKTIEVRARDRRRDPRLGSEAVLATAETLPRALVETHRLRLRGDATNILLGCGFIVAGVVGLIVASLRRRRRDVAAVAALGTFTLLYGARLVIDSYLPLLLGVPLHQRAFAEAFLTYVIPIPGWLVAQRLMGSGWNSTLRWQVITFAIFAPLAIASDLITGRPESLGWLNNILVVAGGLNILFNLPLTPRRDTTDLRVVLAGSAVFMVFAVGNNLGALGLLPWRFEAEAAGLAVFVGTLAYAAMRTFTREEREQTAIEHEMSAAREIQRAILPTRMPDVAGLRFQTMYEPATSVAGDLYDFLRVDAKHAGVLVADVAGHGVPAALIASMVKIAASSQSARLTADPAAMLAELSATLRAEVRRAFVTATYLWFDMEARTVSVCNAGHPAPLLYRNGLFQELGASGVLLGRFAGAQYTATTTRLEPGDRIVAFTDGITEARNARDEQFGEERLREAIARGGVADVVAAVHQWRVTDDADDLTVVSVDVTA